jgi:hypothetical protein
MQSRWVIKKTAKFRKVLAGALWLLVAAVSPASAQMPTVVTPDQLIQMTRSQPALDISTPVTASASFDPPLVRPGEKSIYRITLNTTEAAVRLPDKIIAPAALHLHASVSAQNMEPIGGALQMVSTFDYDADATQPGMFTVPEFTVNVQGRPVVVPGARLEVSDTLPATHEPARQLFVEPATTNMFVGESFNVSVLLPSASANRVMGVSQVELHGNGFLVQNNPGRQTIQMQERNGRRVPVYIYETSVTPIAAGRLALTAQGFTMGMSFNEPAREAGGQPRYILLDSEPVSINVRPLPTDNELPGFTGAVGSYTCDPPVLATNLVKAGEPVQLSVVIRGQPNLDRITFPAPPHVPDWQIFPATREGLVAGMGTNHPGVRFAYTLIPLTDNLSATPAIPFSSFDPARGNYVDLTIPPVPITILPGEITNTDTALMLLENMPEPERKLSLSRLSATPGRRADSLVPWQRHAWFPLVELLPPLGFCGLWFWDRRRFYLEQHPDIVRRRHARRALRRERRRLEQTAASGDAGGFLRCAIHALQIASAPHYPAVPRALVCHDVLQILTVAEREGKPGEIVRRFFNAADAAAFASTAEAHVGLLAEKLALQEILAELEARL